MIYSGINHLDPLPYYLTARQRFLNDIFSHSSHTDNCNLKRDSTEYLLLRDTISCFLNNNRNSRVVTFRGQSYSFLFKYATDFALIVRFKLWHDIVYGPLEKRSYCIVNTVYAIYKYEYLIE